MQIKVTSEKRLHAIRFIICRFAVCSVVWSFCWLIWHVWMDRSVSNFLVHHYNHGKVGIILTSYLSVVLAFVITIFEGRGTSGSVNQSSSYWERRRWSWGQIFILFHFCCNLVSRCDPMKASLSDYLLQTVLDVVNREGSDTAATRHSLQYFQLFVMYAGIGVPEVCKSWWI